MAVANTIIPLKIGIDFGGVLSIHFTHHRSNEDEQESLKINMPDALTNLIQLKEYGHKLYLISFCGRKRAKKIKENILQLIPKNDLFDEIYFVRRISYKADVCRAIGCDLMIDDTLKILRHIHHVIPTMKLIWFSSLKTKSTSDITKVNSWSILIKTIDEILIHQVIRHEVNSCLSLVDKLHVV